MILSPNHQTIIQEKSTGTMVLKNNKKKHTIMDNSNVGVGVGEDKISKLPNELIHHILSFLPTKCAMSTCILSKRWKCVSYSIPTLDFRNWQSRKGTRKEQKQETRCFMDFLDTVLYHHEKPIIQKFYLVLDEFFDRSRAKKWISTIMKRKVEEFVLSVHMFPAPSILPLSFFTCDSLTLLDLHFYTMIVCEINIPNTVSFPKLKVLRLTYLIISTSNLLSNCPILEVLRLSRCAISGGLCITNSALKHLSITSCRFTASMSTVKISAPKLLTINYSNNSEADFVLDSFPSLVKAEVSFLSLDKASVKLLEKLSNTKLLKICADSFLDLIEADIIFTGSLTFNNLIQLEIGTSINHYTCFATVSTFFKFLQLSPNLQSIIFAQRIHFPDEEDDCWSLDPEYSLQHLMSVKFMYFQGEPMELNAVKLILKYAEFLETVTIITSHNLSKDHQEQLNVMKQLLLYPKPAGCVVKFLTSSENA